MKRLELADKLVDLMKKHGADEAEAYVSESSEVTIQVQNGKADSVVYKNSGGYGLRALIDGRIGFASCNRLDDTGAEDIVRKLIKDTRLNTPDEFNHLPDRVENKADADLEQFDETLKAMPVESKIDLALNIEKVARAYDDRIVQIGWLQYGDDSEEYAIASTRGIRGETRHSSAYGFAMAVAMEKNSSGQVDPATAQTGSGIGVGNYFSKLNPEEIGQKAARYAVRMLGAKEGQTSETEAVFPPESGSNFIDLIASMVSAELVQKKKSIFWDKMNQMIASSQVTIIDDGRLPGGLATAAVDAEGIPTTAKEIISQGKLSQLLYDSYTAKRGGTASTGNADRASYTTRPGITPSNFYMKSGDISRDNLIGKVSEGLYITELSGLHAAVDPITGQFSIPAKGIKISAGELTQPISDISLSGNLFDFLKDIDIIADDLTWEINNHVVGVPTFKVKNIKISGA